MTIKDSLTKSLKELNGLIELTKDDIALIKEAKHSELIGREQEKKRVLESFENSKYTLNKTLLELTKNGADIEEILDEEESRLFEEFKSALVELKELNRYYLTLVVSVNEFFTSLLSKMFEFDKEGYQNTNPLPARVLKVSA
jgi:hypothetical protein